ncbi:allophanate hydrolase-related protein [Microbulbifer sp. ZKSA002]|uniref:allophanate hydrolase-related protein n=1 Tax=Microbulbifer sp. ZKSA002 TaxID=3243388 RepID=UPI00403A0E86
MLRILRYIAASLMVLVSLANAESIDVAVNGTLMRGFALEKHMLKNHATFVREAKTASIYRMWSIGDKYPAMERVLNGGTWIKLEIWSIPQANLVNLLEEEAKGLVLGKVALADGTQVLGILGENYIVQNQKDISKWHGWRAYTESMGMSSNKTGQ